MPALAATTPRARWSASSRAMRLYAPRGLNDPVRCRFSHLSRTSWPVRSDRMREATTGVRRMTGSSSSSADAISDAVTRTISDTVAVCQEQLLS